MNRQEFQILCNSIADEVEKLLPHYLQNPEDASISRGGSALAILNAKGEAYGRMYGDKPARQRECAQTAWKKANQPVTPQGNSKLWFTQNKLTNQNLVCHALNISVGLAV
jgi:hypothetical protein